MKTSIVGYPRIGRARELKFTSEKYFRNEVSQTELEKTAADIRKLDRQNQKNAGIDFISSNDFSFYDNILDTAVLFNIIPARYKELNLSALDTYFAMARGYQGENGNVKALAMKKWFNTNYHYIVPEFEDDTTVKLSGTKPLDEYKEALKNGVDTKINIIGPFTFLKLVKYKGTKTLTDYADALTKEYIALLKLLAD